MAADNDPVQLRRYRGRPIEKVHWNGDDYAVIDPNSRALGLSPPQRDALGFFLDVVEAADCALCGTSFSPSNLGYRPLARILLWADSAEGICVACADQHRTALALVSALWAQWEAEFRRSRGEFDDDEDNEEEPDDDPHHAA